MRENSVFFGVVSLKFLVIFIEVSDREKMLICLKRTVFDSELSLERIKKKKKILDENELKCQFLSFFKRDVLKLKNI